VADIEEHFGGPDGGSLRVWRNALSRITDNGRLNLFSSQFTRRTGPEIVTSSIQNLEVDANSPWAGATVTVKWDCDQNPPETIITKIEL
jgi:hypothetical protein